jgi:Flp pilus assembly protein TadD
MPVLVCLLLCAAANGCAARGETRLDAAPASRGNVPDSAHPSATPAAAASTPGESLETFMGKVRERASRAAPPAAVARTVEASDPALGAALALATLRPTSSTHRVVAREYMRVGILDKAHEHLTLAVTADPRDAAAWDGLARIWRDWGFPHLGLPDAYRALYFAPQSPVVRNTLGTILQALGRRQEARLRFEQALALDPGAAYALSNLCYGWLLDGDAGKASDACRGALRLQPDLAAAQNNLALAYEATGDLVAAEAAFETGGDRARALYNLGIVHLARRRYAEATKVLEEARALRPKSRQVDVMARRARDLAREGQP